MGSDNYGSDAQGGEVRDADNVEQTEELDFEHSFDNLPWLESDDDYEEQSVDTARVVIVAIMGLLAIALVVGGIWWATQEKGSGERIAQGGTIEAPAGPYKTKPEDPGGKTFEGTGDTSFAVAEGQTREGKIAAAPLPKPSIDVAGSGSTQAAATPTQTPPPAPALTGVGVQVGAYSNRADAERGWQTLSGRFDALHGVSHRIVEGQADIGRVFRLQAVAGDLAAANSLCQQLRAAGGACQVKR